ncbi:hypothetical protein ACJX0J_014182, partial [Zea mays]
GHTAEAAAGPPRQGESAATTEKKTAPPSKKCRVLMVERLSRKRKTVGSQPTDKPFRTEHMRRLEFAFWFKVSTPPRRSGGRRSRIGRSKTHKRWLRRELGITNDVTSLLQRLKSGGGTWKQLMSHNGQKITFPGEADEAPDTATGDIIFVLQQKEHPKFKRKGDDLFYEHTLTLTESLCGFQFVLTHLDNRQLLIKSNPGEVVNP